MAAHIFTTTPSHLALSFPSSTNPSNPPVLLSSFRGVSLKLPRQSLSLAATIPNKPFSVFAVAKKAVAVLKGNSEVEGVVTLTQENDGLCSFFPLFSSFYLLSNAFCDLGFFLLAGKFWFFGISLFALEG